MGKKQPAKNGEVLAKLDALGVDYICGRIIGGESQSRIARDLGFSHVSMIQWIAKDSERQKKIREARIQSADAYADMAEEVLLNATDDKMGISKARELASHYRWMASKRRPVEYGDRVVQEISGANGSAIEIKADITLSPDQAYLKMIGK